MLLCLCTCIHGSLSVQAVSAALVGLSAQSDSDWLHKLTSRRAADARFLVLQVAAAVAQLLRNGTHCKQKQ
ncbi:hypothetical protein XENOCAPTIV_025775 [Xenoophorus captivus]|uniref:Secreted protein n=1 Tax=Xenoophorus captivus TaxID=1517983 RepID=A0ABV0RLU8_9TELE